VSGLADTLSQAEIDALFGGLAAEADEPAETSGSKKTEKKHSPYDFRNPKIFSKDQIKQIERIYDIYAKHLSSLMTGLLRTECTLAIDAIEELRYFEYSNGLQESIMMGVLEVKPLEGNMLIEIKRETCYLIIDRLLGGVGEDPYVQSEFSEIDLRLLEKFYQQIIRFLKEAWANVTDMEPVLVSTETNARLTQLMPIDEVVIIVMMTVKIHDHEGTMTVCIPCINLDAILGDALNYAMLHRRRNKSEEEAERTKNSIFDHIKTSKLDIRGILGSATLTLQDVSHLQVGDVIPMNKPVDSPVVLRVGTIDWFDGEIGVKRNRMAVKVRNVLKKI
jgi:flagellar motor switch protein FliM